MRTKSHELGSIQQAGTNTATIDIKGLQQTIKFYNENYYGYLNNIPKVKRK